MYDLHLLPTLHNILFFKTLVYTSSSWRESRQPTDGRLVLTNHSAHKPSLITLSSLSVTTHCSKPRCMTCKDDESGGKRKEREQSNVLQNNTQMGFCPDLGGTKFQSPFLPNLG